MKYKRKIDKEMLVLNEFLKKKLSLYRALNITFEIKENNDPLVINGDNIEGFNAVFNPKLGILPMFVEEINDICKNKDFLNKKEGLPFVYTQIENGMLPVEAEIFETDKKQKEAILTIMLSVIDYSLENKLKEAYKKHYGEEAEINYQNQKPVTVDITDIYENFKYKYNNNMLTIKSEDKDMRLQRIAHERKKNEPALSNTTPTKQERNLTGGILK